jgi:hypothetical protein
MMFRITSIFIKLKKYSGLVIIVVYSIKIGLVEFDNESICIDAFKQYTSTNFTENKFDNFNWKNSKPYKDAEIMIRVGCVNV